jgi:hypothetical protein
MFKPTRSQIESIILEILKKYIPAWDASNILDLNFVPYDYEYFCKSDEERIIKEIEDTLGVIIPLTKIFEGPNKSYSVYHASNLIFYSLTP